MLEQNALPGRATRLLAARADVVAASFVGTASELPRARVVHTGNPIRPEVTAMAAAAFGPRCRHVLVMGGSQGSRRLNEAVMAGLRDLLEDPQLTVTHQTGELDHLWVLRFHEALPESMRSRYQVAAFFVDIAAEEAAADLVVMRAGGSSLAEVAVLGRPMVLVPYPHAGGHQRFNAEPYVAAGAASSVADEELSGTRLLAEVRRVVDDPAAWLAMAAASAAMGRPNAADQVVGLIRDVVERRQSRSAA